MNIHINYNGAPYWMEYQRLTFKKNVFHRNAIELIFVIKGELTANVDGQITILTEGEFLLINAGILHELKGKKNTYITSLYIDLDYYEEEYPFIRGYNFYCYYNKEDSQNDEIYYILRNYFIRLLIMEFEKLPKIKEIAASIISNMLQILINHVFDNEYIKNKPSGLKDADRERILSMTTYMSKNYNRQGLSLADLAAHENLSATRLSHFWKSITNISFMDTIVLYRHNEARRLLMEGELSVNEITQICGISDEKYLYKAFKEKYNMTPKEYRDHHNKQMEVPDVYEPTNISAIYDVIKDYLSKYYYKLHDFSFLGQNFDRIEEEKNINELYGVITLTEKHERTSPKNKINEDNNSFNIRFGINKGIKKDDEQFNINWEYVYAIMQVSELRSGLVSLIIQTELMSTEQWMSIFIEIRNEIEKEKGMHYSTIDRIIVAYTGFDNYEKAAKLENELNKSRLFNLVVPVLYV